MARTARAKEHFGTYYISQQSSGCRPLFYNNCDRDYFIDLLRKAVNKFNCRIIEYCIQDNNTYHIIIDVNGGDLSKIMKSINIPYGMYATCEGKLFRDRFKSQPIQDEEDLSRVRDTIQSSIDPNGGFSSFCGTEIRPTANQAPSSCINCLATLDEAKQHIEQIADQKGLPVDELLRDKPLRNQLIKDIRRYSTLSLKSIGQVFGGISESSVCKILNQ